MVDFLIKANWLSHGFLGIISLILIIWIFITGTMLAGRINKPKNSNPFKSHKRLALFFGFLIIGTFSYGLWLTSERGEPMLSSIHGWLGLLILVFSLLQLIPSLVIKTRTKIKKIHRIVGYTLIALMISEVSLGLHIAVLGKIKPLILIHSFSGAIAAFAFCWIIVEMRNLTETGIIRARRASYVAVFFITIGGWVVGGYNYLRYYGSEVKPVILAGTEPWAHQIVMETKEHIFLFLPVITILLAVTLKSLGQNNSLLADSKSRRGVILIASFALIFVLLMFIMGALISHAGYIGLKGK